ncbi:MAG: hypothetical protein E4G92_03005 [Bacteroidia bacterium]|nr:MAG: hypothetical protein E4G92_03005 [Bacteroidia bacterium]
MKRLSFLFVISVCIILLAGCATVKIYSDPDLKNETGLRYYTLKPYLLVEYMAEKDNTVKTTVIYRPDLASPQYMLLKPGIGSNDLKMTFTNSALTTYGVITESQLPESLEAFANVLSKSAYAAQTFTRPGSQDTRNQEEESGNQEPGRSFRLFEILPGSDGAILREVILSDR